MSFENIKKNFGFGCMRLPMKDGQVDNVEMCKMVDAFMEAGAKCVTLGPRILRAETAAVTAAGVIMSLWGDI